MASKPMKQKQMPVEDRRRGGGGDLADFADYVEKEQQKQQARQKEAATVTSTPAGLAAPSLGTASADPADEFDELSFIDNLGLNDDEASHAKLKDQLLRTAPGFDEMLKARLEEGRGETLFDLGYENSGDSMKFTKDQYDKAYVTLVEAAKKFHAECSILHTVNLGVESEPPSGKDDENPAGSANSKPPAGGDGCRSKVMVRQVPATMEDLLEIRVAVVGNGK